MMWSFIICIMFCSFAKIECVHSVNMHRIFVAELFSTKIEPKLFNWTHQGLTEQYRYRPSLEGYPDLPSWMRYMYSNDYHAGFLYGTPPEQSANREIRIEVVALNKQNYETRTVVIVIIVSAKSAAKNTIEMKINSLNWVHMMDPGRVENLKNIFTKDLWQEASDDLHVVFMDSAVQLGGRIPLRPHQHEGIIVHLGSNAPFSQRIQELHEEVKPLYKISSCVYKRTSVQTVFEDAGFKPDWCAFKIFETEGHGVFNHPHTMKNSQDFDLNSARKLNRWNGMAKVDAPDRNYIDELAIAVAIPGVILALLLAILSTILCFHNELGVDEKSEVFFYNLFNVCFYPSLQKINEKSIVHMVHSNGNSHPTTTLKSLKDAPNLVFDNLSLPSQSPSNSIYREGSPLGNNYIRPKPPPYKPTALPRSCTSSQDI